MTQVRGASAVVTGAARGLGFAIAQGLLDEGARVTLSDVDQEALDRAMASLLPTSETDAVRCDVSREEDVLALLQRAERKFGPIDILVNNAGVVVAGRADAISRAQWEWMFDVNVLGHFHAIHACLPQMRQRDRGHIVGVASVAGLSGYADLAGYCSTKFAVVGLYESLAADLYGTGVAVTVACPGGMATEFGSSLQWGGEDAREGADPAELVRRRRAAATGAPSTEGMDPAVAASLIISAIQDNQFMVDTHPQYRDFVGRKSHAPQWGVKQIATGIVDADGEVGELD